nr:MAG TPA: hypothetical protein [Caudoviricetes sp.]
MVGCSRKTPLSVQGSKPHHRLTAVPLPFQGRLI